VDYVKIQILNYDKISDFVELLSSSTNEMDSEEKQWLGPCYERCVLCYELICYERYTAIDFIGHHHATFNQGCL